jgi:protein-disulfide isomerase
LVAVGCQERSTDLDEVMKDQREIFYRIGALEKSIQFAATAPAPATPPPKPVDPDKVWDIPVGDSPVKGPKNAPVTIVEFSDFQCPPCGEVRPLVKQVLDAYPKEVKLVYKMLPLTSIHNNAMAAAKAAVAAGRQGKFWEMHDILYQNQDALGTDNLTAFAGKIGLDVPRWVKDFSSAEVEAQVRKEAGEARAAEVDGTPTFFVNGKRLADRSFDEFKQLIDAALKDKPRKKS